MNPAHRTVNGQFSPPTAPSGDQGSAQVRLPLERLIGLVAEERLRLDALKAARAFGKQQASEWLSWESIRKVTSWQPTLRRAPSVRREIVISEVLTLLRSSSWPVSVDEVIAMAEGVAEIAGMVDPSLAPGPARPTPPSARACGLAAIPPPPAND